MQIFAEPTETYSTGEQKTIPAGAKVLLKWFAIRFHADSGRNADFQNVRQDSNLRSGLNRCGLSAGESGSGARGAGIPFQWRSASIGVVLSDQARWQSP